VTDEYWRKPWMTDDQWNCAQLLSDAFGGFHNMKEMKPCADGVRVILRQRDLGTYDFGQLTHIVVLAHVRCIRVSICLAGMYLEARAYQRKRTGSTWERHPTLPQALEAYMESSG
jgi:hypothetical protein